MKSSFLFFFFCFSLQAATLTKYKNIPEHQLSEKFVLGGQQGERVKSTNFFETPRSSRIGTFRSKDKQLKLLNQKLEVILAKIKTTDTYLKSQNSSFNDLTGPLLHETYWILGPYKVKQASDYNMELEEIFTALQKLNWSLVDGIELSADQKKKKIFRASKLVKTEKVLAEECGKKFDGCEFTNLGSLYRK